MSALPSSAVSDVVFPERVTLRFHRCGGRVNPDGWCDRCQRTPTSDEYVTVEYVRDPDVELCIGCAPEAGRFNRMCPRHGIVAEERRMWDDIRRHADEP
jgi:hypothetical protein